MSRLGVLAAIAAGALSRGAAADVVWDEGVDGDLSGERLAPTDLGSFGNGTHSIIVTSVGGDREYLTLSIGAGRTLDAIVLASYDSEDDRSFIGVQEGSVFTEPSDAPDVGNLLGWTHFGTAFAHVGTDILDDIGLGAGAIGFTPPLPSASYTFWAQETGQISATYRLDFVVSPAPASLVLLALAGCARRRR